MEPPPRQKRNPIQTAVSAWLDALPPALLEAALGDISSDGAGREAKQQLVARAPKRWIVYEPMVLLPSGSFTATPWPALLSRLGPAETAPLWTSILKQLSPRGTKTPLTHLAINEGIPLHLSPPPTEPGDTEPGAGESTSTPQQENLLRSPTRLRPLHGTFGPDPAASSSSPHPTDDDFAAHLWVSTRQNGLLQTWSPLHTMFSRGNVKEKARLLAFHDGDCPPPSPSSATGTAATPKPTLAPTPRRPRRNLPAAALRGKFAIDLYAGIGYFAFCYARLGLRVLCWEVSAWSVEGLRRGAEANGFSVRVVRPAADPDFHLDLRAAPEQIIVFHEDNRFAARRIRALGALPVLHVNCGFLPSSQPVWRDAWDMVTANAARGVAGGGGWLHLHENVGEGDIEARRAEVQGLVDQWRMVDGEDEGKKGMVEHVELVKTFAPGVWHCVFDVFVSAGVGGGT